MRVGVTAMAAAGVGVEVKVRTNLLYIKDLPRLNVASDLRASGELDTAEMAGWGTLKLSQFSLITYHFQVELEIAEMAGWGTFKPLLTEALIAHLDPIQKR